MTKAEKQAAAGSLFELVAAQKQGEARGITSVCSSNSFVLQAAMQQARQDGRPLLVEATSNQVNQFGGYMGQTPAQFRESLSHMAAGYELAPGQIILGGDHLGPNAWQNEPAQSAMQKSRRLVGDYVRAGFVKIHLDASMRLGDDPAGPLAVEVSARRAAELCRSAEEAWRSLPSGSPLPCYVIGTEVPIPGGAQEETGELEVTTVESARQTIEITRQAFEEQGVQPAWERVIALVVQPGVEFGDATIHPYQREKAAALSRFIEGVPGMVYEAHSTDYQTPQALRALVEDHFAILKVGPGLTFAFREAVFALELIEQELLADAPGEQRSNLQAVVEAEMLAHPQDWKRYYHGTPEEQRLKRRYSLSDRIRYYWNRPGVQAALERLLQNLEAGSIPLTLVSQFLPGQFRRIQQGELSAEPRALIHDKVSEVLRDYRYGCEGDKG